MTGVFFSNLILHYWWGLSAKNPFLKLLDLLYFTSGPSVVRHIIKRFQVQHVLVIKGLCVEQYVASGMGSRNFSCIKVYVLDFYYGLCLLKRHTRSDCGFEDCLVICCFLSLSLAPLAMPLKQKAK